MAWIGMWRLVPLMTRSVVTALQPTGINALHVSPMKALKHSVAAAWMPSANPLTIVPIHLRFSRKVGRTIRRPHASLE